MAWRVDSLDTLKEFYNRLKEKGVENKPADHGISLGIYFNDPDGNGIEVYYETPRSQWYRNDNVFMSSDRPRGQFPGPWDEVLASQAAR